jgi:hypothetical protein
MEILKRKDQILDLLAKGSSLMPMKRTDSKIKELRSQKDMVCKLGKKRMKMTWTKIRMIGRMVKS